MLPYETRCADWKINMTMRHLLLLFASVFVFPNNSFSFLLLTPIISSNPKKYYSFRNNNNNNNYYYYYDDKNLENNMKTSSMRFDSSSRKDGYYGNDDDDKEEEEETRRRSFRSKQQKRRKHSPTRRKPKYYWTNQINLRIELEDFWSNLGVVVDDDDVGVVASTSTSRRPKRQQQQRRRRLCVPNEALLNYFNRHDIRAAIASNGGRDEVAVKLAQFQQQEEERGGGGAATTGNSNTVIDIMPGKWKDAVETSPELQILLKNSTIALNRDVPPSSAFSSLSSTSSPSRKKANNNNQPNNYTTTTNNTSITNTNATTTKRIRKRTTITTTTTTTTRWSHNQTQRRRKPKGYWTNQETVIIELYEYLDWYNDRYGRPSIWMPRQQELIQNDRIDLKCAINRFFPSSSVSVSSPTIIGNTGSSNKLKRTTRRRNIPICQVAGLIPYREWNFFEGQYELLLLLKQYMDKYDDDDDSDNNNNQYNNNNNNDDDDYDEEAWKTSRRKYQIFPNVSKIKDRGYRRLYLLIQYYGGRKFLASRLGMMSRSSRTTNRRSSKRNDNDDHNELNWGNFSIEFAIKLCELIRRDHMRVKPPIRNPVICIPTQNRLLHAGRPEGIWLHNKIIEFGGYENVARRLYLGYRFK